MGFNSGFKGLKLLVRIDSFPTRSRSNKQNCVGIFSKQNRRVLPLRSNAERTKYPYWHSWSPCGDQPRPASNVYDFWHVYVLGGVWKKKSRNIVTSSHPVLIRVWCNKMLEQWNLLETLTLTLATYTHVWARNALGGKGVTEQRYPLRR